MKKSLIVAAAVFSLPMAAQAQSLQPGGSTLVPKAVSIGCWTPSSLELPRLRVVP